MIQRYLCSFIKKYLRNKLQIMRNLLSIFGGTAVGVNETAEDQNAVRETTRGVGSDVEGDGWRRGSGKRWGRRAQ